MCARVIRSPMWKEGDTEIYLEVTEEVVISIQRLIQSLCIWLHIPFHNHKLFHISIITNNTMSLKPLKKLYG